MNNERRKQINKLADTIAQIENMRDDLLSEIQTILEDEQEYFDNMPESFQGGDKGERAQAAIDALQSAVDILEGFDVSDISSSLDTASE